MNIPKRIKARLKPPEKALAVLRPELEKLIADLEKISRDAASDPLSNIVPSFRITSAWHDRGLRDIIATFACVNDGQYDTIIGKLTTLHHQFIAIGRDVYGWNRTKRGEEVTSDTIFLGDIFGMPTRPVSYWVQKDPNEREDKFFDEYKNPHGVISAQARILITRNADIMAQRVRELIAA